VSAIDGAMPTHDSITWNHAAVHAEVTASMFNKGVNLLERALVQELVNALACCHFPFFMLASNAFCTPSHLSSTFAAFKVVQPLT
tara:strand:- start:136 stop:390 length:255 start_codon:yes stop_codon:yes gene_type:complete